MWTDWAGITNYISLSKCYMTDVDHVNIMEFLNKQAYE